MPLGSAEHTPELPTLICTKLQRPRLPGDLNHCQRLPDRLDAGLERNLTLISAPAGFRNTTLISEPVDQAGPIGVINHVNMLGFPLLSVKCASVPVENWPVMEGDH